MGFAMSGCEAPTYGPHLAPLKKSLPFADGIWGPLSSFHWVQALTGAGTCQLAASSVSGASVAGLEEGHPQMPSEAWDTVFLAV